MDERIVRNQAVIEEFRANGGVVGGAYEGRDLLLLHHQGARTGASHISPLCYLPAGEALVVVAANGGRPNHPGWYHNLVARPEVEVEVGADRRSATARIAQGTERDALVQRFHQETPFFTRFADAAGREIPVVVIEPR
ncbi:hypothetical protein GCM10022243_34810 [Saccharothrix violaceirubra]|uniref:Deazaflavin-dependent oxidoreductase (Nitroreductase family) n=1 Tax=Saccharothrix violaceirubra TaxID=413306 RepID=A0A7W7T4Q4_9PSEU|nr:nitroreductase/quinone reductase family protein [Saccharothrix violaceirubra]MBB4966533.1 deazaflavin-dependent oxidoreductase (nitroreductase family) [Saccharothrix violaceirubra]